MTVATVSVDRLLASASGSTSSSDLDGHLATHGALTLPVGADPEWAGQMVRSIAGSGLRGRGGAGFPTAEKWQTVAGVARRALLVVNGMEGEPASGKDRLLLTRAPHLVLDGAEIAATATGCSEVVVCVADDNGPAATSIERAIAERSEVGLGALRVALARPPAGYVTGEESALVNWIGSRRALPVLRADKSVALRTGRRPALVQNVETLAHVALIARHGPDWFRRLGTPDAPGSTLVTVTGAVATPGVLEVELGTPVREILDRCRTATELSAVLLGGYSGTWLDGSLLATPYAPGSLADVGATGGAGVVVALPTTSCGIGETARLVRYLAGESAGQCGPCVHGLPAVADDLERLWQGRPDRAILDRIGRRLSMIEGRGACRHPDGAVRLVRSALTVFAHDAADHARGQPCPGQRAPSVLTRARSGHRIGWDAGAGWRS
jgi:NADH:ubiquinone oxidoreductase subunit F (NADH-binding)